MLDSLITKINENLEPLNIITLQGDHGSGKDEYALKLSETLNSKNVILRFADPIREIFVKSMNLKYPEDLDILKRHNLVFKNGSKVLDYDVGGLTVREALVKVAESEKDCKGSYLWANLLTQRLSMELDKHVSEFTSSKFSVIIPDLRFKEEENVLVELIEKGFRHFSFGIGSFNEPFRTKNSTVLFLTDKRKPNDQTF